MNTDIILFIHALLVVAFTFSVEGSHEQNGHLGYNSTATHDYYYLSHLARLSRAQISLRCKHKELWNIWNRRRAKTPKRGVVIWQCLLGYGCGGNGDRLRGISGALYNAIRTGYDFAIHWDNPVPVDFFLSARYPPLKNITDYDINLNATFLSSPSGVPPPTLAVASFDHKDSTLQECAWVRYDNVLVRSNELYSTSCGDEGELKPFFFANQENVADLHWNRYPCLGCIFWFLFSISPPLQISIERELRAFAEWMNATNRSHISTVAIHFRGGDHYMNVGQEHRGEKRMELTQLHNMIACAEKIERNSPELPTIFLCADSQAAKAYAKTHYGDRVYTSSIIPFHTDREGADPGNGTMGTWTDLMLLGLADGIVLSSSGYGVLAAQIGMYDRAQIITSGECFGVKKNHNGAG